MIDRLPEKAGSRNSGNTDFSNHPLAKLKICPPFELGPVQKILNIDHDKIGSLRNVVLQSYPVKALDEVVPFLGVRLLQSVIVFVSQFKPGNSSLL